MNITELLEKNYISELHKKWLLENDDYNTEFSIAEYSKYNVIYTKNTTLIVLNNLKDFFYITNEELRTKCNDNYVIISSCEELILLQINDNNIIEIDGTYC